MPTFATLKSEYARLWQSMQIRADKAGVATAWAKQIIAYKAGRYAKVEAMTGVPWYIVGIIHLMEAGLAKNAKGELSPRFDRHLHNGDPLSAKTVQVPAGRPALASWTWAESAADALNMKKLGSIKEWTIERIAYQLEAYNGWGYRKPGYPATPYLWSFSNHYGRGKYVRDRVYDASAVSGQIGAMLLLKTLMQLDPEVAPRMEGEPIEVAAAIPVMEAHAEPLPEETVADPSQSFPAANPPAGLVKASVEVTATAVKAVRREGVVQDIVNAAGVLAAGFFGVLGQLWSFVLSLFEALPSVSTSVGNQLDAAKKVTSWFNPDPSTWMKISAGLAATLIVVAIIRLVKPGTAK